MNEKHHMGSDIPYTVMHNLGRMPVVVHQYICLTVAAVLLQCCSCATLLLLLDPVAVLLPFPVHPLHPTPTPPYPLITDPCHNGQIYDQDRVYDTCTQQGGVVDDVGWQESQSFPVRDPTTWRWYGCVWAQC